MKPIDLIRDQATLDRLYVREILAAFFSDRFAEQIQVDERTIAVVTAMLKDAAVRPEWVAFMAPGLSSGADHNLKCIRKIAKRLITHPALKMTLASRRTRAWKYRMRLTAVPRDA